MRAGFSAGPVWIGGSVPGPKRIAKGSYGLLELLVTLPVWALVAVIYAIAIAIYALTAVIWLLIWTVKVVFFWLPVVLTAPIRGPIRGWWRHHNRVLVRKVERRTAKQKAGLAEKALNSPPVGPRQG